MKQEVYLNEFNVVMEKSIYLPLVSGLLQSYALTFPAIKDHYRFMPFFFKRDEPTNILTRYKNPGVVAFSVSMWNMNLSLSIARELKKAFPGCLIVFGGPHVPFDADEFFQRYPFIDVAARGDGEETFAEILIRHLESSDFEGIPGISYRDRREGRCVKNEKERPFVKDLDVFPSPYLEGAYDYLFSEDINFQAIIETSRGCPYNCSYCFWGKGGLSKRYSFFSLERVKKVADWCGTQKIKYVFCADSNFGTFERDLEIARYFAETKRQYGYPEKFRVCYAKNAEHTVFEIGKLLHQYDMEKSVTMARQTNSEVASLNVGRKNIKMAVFNNLQRKYNQENIPVYTELILGLPGESYESFLKGIEEVLASGIKNQIFVYFCQVYPNTELADKKYQGRHKISTVSIPLHETHAAARAQESVVEYEEIICSTSSMSCADWKKMAVVAWMTQLFHSLKIGFYILLYLNDRHKIDYTGLIEYISLMKIRSERVKIMKNEVAKFYEIADGILRGGPRTQHMPEFGNVYWDQEEASYLRILGAKDDFYNEMTLVLKEYLDGLGIAYDKAEAEEVIKYQAAVVPDFSLTDTEFRFCYNMPEYFDTFFSPAKAALAKRSAVLTLTQPKDYKGDKLSFATQVVLYGRKSDKMLRTSKWMDAAQAG